MNEFVIVLRKVLGKSVFGIVSKLQTRKSDANCTSVYFVLTCMDNHL